MFSTGSSKPSHQRSSEGRVVLCCEVYSHVGGRESRNMAVSSENIGTDVRKSADRAMCVCQSNFINSQPFGNKTANKVWRFNINRQKIRRLSNKFGQSLFIV